MYNIRFKEHLSRQMNKNSVFSFCSRNFSGMISILRRRQPMRNPHLVHLTWPPPPRTGTVLHPWNPFPAGHVSGGSPISVVKLCGSWTEGEKQKQELYKKKKKKKKKKNKGRDLTTPPKRNA
jgi:hypothetical protein